MNAEMHLSFCLGFYADVMIPPCHRIAYISVKKVTLQSYEQYIVVVLKELWFEVWHLLVWIKGIRLYCRTLAWLRSFYSYSITA